MSSLVVLIPLGVMLLAIAIGAFVWAVRHGQFDDLGAEGLAILLDDDRPAPDPDASDEDEDASA